MSIFILKDNILTICTDADAIKEESTVICFTKIFVQRCLHFYLITCFIKIMVCWHIVYNTTQQNIFWNSLKWVRIVYQECWRFIGYDLLNMSQKRNYILKPLLHLFDVSDVWKKIEEAKIWSRQNSTLCYKWQIQTYCV